MLGFCSPGPLGRKGRPSAASFKLREKAEAKAAPAFAAPAPIASRGPGEPAWSLDSLSAAKRKLLAKRIRGER